MSKYKRKEILVGSRVKYIGTSYRFEDYPNKTGEVIKILSGGFSPKLYKVRLIGQNPEFEAYGCYLEELKLLKQ